MGQAQRTLREEEQYYVPAMQAAGDLGQALRGRVQFGAPIVADADLILDAEAVTAALDTRTFMTGFTNSEAQMGRYGRCLQVVATAGYTGAVNIYGRDYLGQKMRETITANEATPVIGVKAFRYVDRITAAATSGDTIDVGTTDKLGLPYTTIKVLSEFVSKVSGTVGTLVAPSFTDPQAVGTADPRGTYDPNGTLDGTATIEIDAEFTSYVNAAGNGGLHGIAHLAA